MEKALRAFGISRNKVKEVDLLRAATKSAFDAPNERLQDDATPLLVSHGEIVTIRPAFKKSSEEYNNLIDTLTDWINNEMASERIVVQDLQEDLFDGLVLARLLGKLYDCQELLALPQITASETGQQQRLRAVLQILHDKMRVPQEARTKLSWSVDQIHKKDELALVRLLIAIARHQHAPIHIPESLMVDLDVLQTSDSAITHTIRSEDIATPLEFTLSKNDTDEVDDLFQNNPDGVVELCTILTKWLNEKLLRLGLQVNDITQLHDGVYLLMAIGLLEGYYIPAYEYHLPAKNDAEKMHNVRLAFDHLVDAGIELNPRVRPADIVNKDLRSLARFLISFYQFYATRRAEQDALSTARSTWNGTQVPEPAYEDVNN